MRTIQAIILAAGRSARLGRPKQLEVLEGEPLLRRTARVVLASRVDIVRVVLGYRADEIGAVLDGLDVDPVSNPEWEEGVASSIRAGIDASMTVEAAIILPCDLPLLSAAHLDELIEAYEGGAEIAASRWDEVVGAPALFDKRYFPELLNLRGDQGARLLLRKFASIVHEVPFPGGAMDVDEPADLERLRINPLQS